MFRTIPVVLGVAAVIACGVVHGYWTDRWNPATETHEAAARLNDLPLTIGDWEGQVIDAKPSPAAGPVAGMIQRRYVQRDTGDTVVIALVCGRPGPVSIHTPDVCYGASGYNVGPRTRKTIAGSDAEFWCADAIKTQAAEETQLRLYWGWSAGSGWKAADDARQMFPRVPVLHKLYVIRELNGAAAKDGDGEPCQRFLQVLLPELDRALFSGGA
jgi:hypothetical protein